MRAATGITEQEFAILFDPFLTWAEIESKLAKLKNEQESSTSVPPTIRVLNAHEESVRLCRVD